ncbi:MAG: hypothetical protein RSD78_07165, partial [Oscillospiraceae bacterium]
ITLQNLLTGKSEKTNRQSVQNAITLQNPNGRSRATAPTEVVERSSIAKYNYIAKCSAMHCKVQKPMHSTYSRNPTR